jgi:hypothetical protein
MKLHCFQLEAEQDIQSLRHSLLAAVEEHAQLAVKASLEAGLRLDELCGSTSLTAGVGEPFAQPDLGPQQSWESAVSSWQAETKRLLACFQHLSYENMHLQVRVMQPLPLFQVAGPVVCRPGHNIAQATWA